MLRKTYIEISRQSFCHNIAQFKKCLPPGGQLMAVVKADGYGHGAVQTALVAQAEGVAWAGVALVEEGIELRQGGVTLPILVLGAWPKEALPYFEQYQLTPTIHSPESARLLQDFAKAKGYQQPVHLKVDTGMGRIGFGPSQLFEFWEHFDSFDHLRVEGIDSHLARADEGLDEPTVTQFTRFNALIEGMDARFMPRWTHIANSSGTCDFKDFERGNLFRIGIGLYGQLPSAQLRNKPDLKQAITFKTEVVQLRDFEVNSPISYGGTWVTKRPSRIACIAVGYGDGYSRALSNRAQVLIRGQRMPVVGRVCMDLTLIDVTDFPEVCLGDQVVLIGRQGDEEILASELADIMGTINYEVCCNLSKRVPRFYLG